jgi:GR25 family glycosyltransferase involved in LPS biosynthesis
MNSKKNPMLCWEIQGPGTAFGKQVLELGYHAVYLKKNETSLSSRVTDTPGYNASRDGKRLLLEQYRRALATLDFLNYSQIALEETLGYVHTAEGVEHQANKNRRLDPTQASMNHGDRVIADALCNKMIGKSGRKRTVELTVQPYSLAWFMRQEEMEAQTREELYPNWNG